MEHKSINLHINNKKTLFLIVFFCVLSVIVNMLILISNKAPFSQLNTLIDSNYYYSVNMDNPISEDCYYQINAGIGFSTERELIAGINADVLMQDKDAIYTNNVFWNAQRLNSNEVAISSGIADKYSLNVGEKLYSKHAVDGNVNEYVIVEILPAAYCSRVSENAIYTSGIIIMAYDANYVDNVSHSCLVFTNTNINEFSSNPMNTPTNIIYRKDEIKTIESVLLPYIGLNVILSVGFTILLCVLLSHQIRYNLKRLLVLGFDLSGLKKSFYKFILCSVLCVIVLGLILTIVFINLYKMGKFELEIYSIISGIDVLILFITAYLMRKRLWRN